MNIELKQTGKLTVAICCMLWCSVVFGQTHNTKCMRCRYSKDYIGNRPANDGNKGRALDECGCELCAKENEKERQAKLAEDKKRDEVIAANIKAEKEAKQKAFEAEQKQAAAKNKSTEVTINMPKETPSAPGNKEVKKNIVLNKGIMYADLKNTLFRTVSPQGIEQINYFVLNNDTLLKGKFRACFSLKSDGNNDYSFPENIGIVALNETKKITDGFGKGKEATICDLVNVSGERLLKNDDITFIMHFYSDWFILFKGWYVKDNGNSYTFTDADIYNITTKESTPLKRNTDNSNYVSNINFKVDYEKPSGDWKNRYRATGTFKAALETAISWNSKIIYYLTNDNKIEYDSYKWQ